MSTSRPSSGLQQTPPSLSPVADPGVSALVDTAVATFSDLENAAAEASQQPSDEDTARSAAPRAARDRV